MEKRSYNQMMYQDQVWASGQGSDDDVGARREFAEGIRKLAGNTSGDRWRKTVRLTARMSEAIGLAGVRSLFSLMVLKVVINWRLDRPGLQLYRPYPIFRVAFSGNAAGADSCTTHTRFF
ncbi:hypothetical protein BHE74_00057064 [Ensete ventricosum]|nr:hypothetical protein BHE74_00057064 [Ensete ventricosum]